MKQHPLEQAARILQQGQVRPSASPGKARARLIQASQTPSSGWGWGWRAAAVAVLALGGVTAIALLQPPEVSFSVADTRGRLGERLEAPSDRPLLLRFSDGAAITLDQGTRAQVISTTQDGASLLLERGTAHLEIPHRPRTRWTLAAGPYLVRVTGTAFDASWEDERFQISMRRGSVLVSGPGIQGAKSLQEQDALQVGPPAPPPSHPAEPSGAASTPSEVSSSPPLTPPKATAPLPEGERWSALLARGDYAAIINAAERKGIEASLRSADLADLSALADAARFLGRVELAREALRVTRERFPATARARSAAFVLGRLEEEQGKTEEALLWYDRYLHESPGGPLLAEALGRKMVALRRAGRLDEARAVAKSYLDRFEEGPYAKSARELLTP